MTQSFKIIGITFYPYSLFLIAGAVVCFLAFFLISFSRHGEFSGENLFAMQMLVISMGIALPSAMVIDSAFKAIETGEFKLGGATFYGGLIAALALFPLLLLFKKNRKVTVYERLCDLAPGIPAGHCLGRIGCFCGGCCFGSPTDCVFGVVFPEGSIPYEFYGGFIKIHPTQLYEAFFLLLLFAFLILFAKKDAFPLYLILYGAVRIFVEFFRNDFRGGTGLPVSPAQLISLLLITTGAVIFTIRYKNKFKES